MRWFRNFIKNTTAREYLYLFLFGVTFESIVVLIARREALLEAFTPWLLGALGLAAYRGGRAIAFNTIFAWLRAPFAATVDDSSGAGQSNEAAGSGIRKVIGELLCCPICSGTWVALVLVSVMAISLPVGTVLIYVLAAAGIAEFLHYSTERAEWQGRAAREESGTLWLLKNKGEDYRQPVVVVVRPSEKDEEAVKIFAEDLQSHYQELFSWPNNGGKKE